VAAPRLRLVLAALASLAVLVGGAVQGHLVFQKHKASSRATAAVAGDLRKPPVSSAVRRAAARKATVGKVTKRKVGKVAKAIKAGKRKPKGRIVTPRPGRKRVPRPAGQAVPVAPAGPNDPLWGSSWSLAKVNAPAAWKLTNGSPETVVAVLDTGADLHHPDLEGAFVPGYDFVNHDDDPSDDHGHGTMVAGVIAARANNGIGGAGTCSRCSVMPVKVIAGNGTGNAGDVALGIAWAADHGARVINLSFVLSGPDDGVANAIAYARGLGAVVVAAAGNAGSPDVTFPAGLPGVVSVTGTDGADARYSWANYGSWVRLAAPGCSQATAPAAGYGDFCGTSSAAAFVSGLAGLARSLAAGATGDAIASELAAHTVPVGSFVSAGRVDAAALLNAFRPAPAQLAPAATSADLAPTPGLD
jgi:subtilisin family serine protease